MAALTTAKTRLGLGGAAMNYSRPFLDKTEAEVAAIPLGNLGSDDQKPRTKRWEKQRKDRERLAQDLRAAYEGIDKDKADAEAIEAVADIIAPHAPVNAPDIPAPEQVDWIGFAEEGRKSAQAALNTLRLIQIRINAMQVEAVRQADDDAAILLLMGA